MKDIKFREYEEKDYSKFKELVFSLYSEDPEGEEIESLKILKTIDEFKLYPEKGKILIFSRKKQIVGYAIVVSFWSNEFGGDIVQIDEMYVKSDCRNQSIGTRFINYLQETKSTKVKGFGIEVKPSNTNALKLYQRLSFEHSDNYHLIKKLK